MSAVIAIGLHIWQGVGGFYLTSKTAPLPTLTDNCSLITENVTYVDNVIAYETTTRYSEFINTNATVGEEGLEL